MRHRVEIARLGYFIVWGSTDRLRDEHGVLQTEIVVALSGRRGSRGDLLRRFHDAPTSRAVGRFHESLPRVIRFRESLS